jgi:Group II intron, maturase-specific domain
VIAVRINWQLARDRPGRLGWRRGSQYRRSRDQTLLDQEMVVAKLNRMMIGWANYFCLGPLSKAYQAVDQHARNRLLQWLCAKHKLVWPGAKRFPESSLHEVLGLVCISKRTSNFPWRPRETFSESRMPETGPFGSMSGV